MNQAHYHIEVPYCLLIEMSLHELARWRGRLQRWACAGYINGTIERRPDRLVYVLELDASPRGRRLVERMLLGLERWRLTTAGAREET